MKVPNYVLALVFHAQGAVFDAVVNVAVAVKVSVGQQINGVKTVVGGVESNTLVDNRRDFAAAQRGSRESPCFHKFAAAHAVDAGGGSAGALSELGPGGGPCQNVVAQLHVYGGEKVVFLYDAHTHKVGGHNHLAAAVGVAGNGGSAVGGVHGDGKEGIEVEIALSEGSHVLDVEAYSDWGQQIKKESYTVESGEEKLVLSHVKEYNDQKRLTKDITRNSTKPTQWVEYLYNKSGEEVKEIHYYPDGSIEYYAETTYEEKPNKVVRTKYYKADGTTYETQWGTTAYSEEYDSYGNEVFWISYEHNKAKEMYVHVYKPYVIPKKDDIE